MRLYINFIASSHISGGNCGSALVLLDDGVTTDDVDGPA